VHAVVRVGVGGGSLESWSEGRVLEEKQQQRGDGEGESP